MTVKLTCIRIVFKTSLIGTALKNLYMTHYCAVLRCIKSAIRVASSMHYFFLTKCVYCYLWVHDMRSNPKSNRQKSKSNRIKSLNFQIESPLLQIKSSWRFKSRFKSNRDLILPITGRNIALL